MSDRRFKLAAALAAATGFLSLSQEILWVKAVGSAARNSPMAFGTVLGSFLVGVAVGALVAPGTQRRLGWSELRYSGACLALGGVLFWLTPPIAAAVLPRSAGAGLLLLHLAVAIVAALMGGLLPVLAHYGVPSDARVGANIALIYLANVLGATLGPLFTGFVLLDRFTMETAFLGVGAMGLLLGEMLWLAESTAGRSRLAPIAALAFGAMALAHRPLYAGFLERLHFRGAIARYGFVAQGRAGIVGVTPGGGLYGEGLYDGGFNLDPSANTNLITRAYLLPVLHERPSRVLEIGLGSGSWARVIASYPDVESLTIVEINPRYVDAVRRYPEIASVLSEPRVSLHFDDARRWLRRRRSAVFDVIVINGTWHWRAHATHLLSAEFLGEIRQHLKPGGVVYFNTTESDDAVYTAAGTFAHVVRFANFVAAGDSAFAMSAARRHERLLRFPGKDGPLFADSANERALRALVAAPLEDLAPQVRSAPNLWYITENNMATEFKTNWSGRWWRDLPPRAFAPERGWLSVLFP